MTKLTLTEYKDCLFNDFELSGVAKLTCLILIEHLNRKTGNCYPSIDRIAEKASFTYNTIAKAITELSEKHYIKIEKIRLSGAKGISNFYSFPNLLPSAFEGRNEGRVEVTSEAVIEAAIEPAIEPSKFDGKPIEPIEPIEPIKEKNKISLNDWQKKNGDLTMNNFANFVKENNLDEKLVGKELLNFKDTALAKGYKYVDWVAAFNKWIRNEKYGKGIDKFKKPYVKPIDDDPYGLKKFDTEIAEYEAKKARGV